MKFIKLFLITLCMVGMFGCGKKYDDYIVECNSPGQGCILEIVEGDDQGFVVEGSEHRVTNLIDGQEKAIEFPKDGSTIIYVKTPVTIFGVWLYDIERIILYSDGTVDKIVVETVPVDYFE